VSRTEKLTPVFFPSQRLAYVANPGQLRAQAAAGLLEVTRVQIGFHKPDKNGNARPRFKIVHAILHEGAPRIKAGTTYHHNHFVAEFYTDDFGRNHKRNELDANPQGVYTLKRIDSRDQVHFVTPLLEIAGLLQPGAEQRKSREAVVRRGPRARHYSRKSTHARPAYSTVEGAV
jgi:hypothetical protein